MSPSADLVADIRQSLNAKLERLLSRPLIARVGPATESSASSEDLPDFFGDLVRIAGAPKARVWREDPDDGTCAVAIALDYADQWRGLEKEVLETVSSTVENSVALLTEHQKNLLERAPNEFLALRPAPETLELVGFVRERVGGADHVVALQLAGSPRAPEQVRFIAVVPNLIPLERQLAALDALVAAGPEGALAPLRALVGLPAVVGGAGRPACGELPGLDSYQSGCARNALSTPHFALIQGPPGSGKTTVISAILRESIARGERVLVVSPTHVAVDNVVEKLLPKECQGDALPAVSLPVRYAARSKKLLDGASAYWVGPKRQKRAATLALRVERRLCADSPFAQALFGRLDPDAAGGAPLTRAVERVQRVICGTPIGILSHEALKSAEPGSFDLLIVDEVSKMTLPEFLAIAVKARRWVLVGDPEQLPPFCSGEENAVTLHDLLTPELELVSSVGAILEREKPALRSALRVAVVTREPTLLCEAIDAHIRQVNLEGSPGVSTLDGGGGILVCTAAELPRALERLRGSGARVLVQRGVRVERPALYSGARLVDDRSRGPAVLFDTAFAVFHAQVWAERSRQKLMGVRLRKGLDKVLPSEAASRALYPGVDAARVREELLLAIARRYATQTVSVYDWLAGVRTSSFDCSPLRELGQVLAPLEPLREQVRPYQATLGKQYRMHSSLSRVPRELFYFGEALLDGRPDKGGNRVKLVQVTQKSAGVEQNADEADAILDTLVKLSGRRARVMVITPYREQERLLSERLDRARAEGSLGEIEAEVCTLDRCQGREAEYVFISLVRNRATPFLDAPKRWNVALTRAMEGLAIFGDIEAYLREAEEARRRAGRSGPPAMSLLARILESYQQRAERGAESARRSA